MTSAQSVDIHSLKTTYFVVLKAHIKQHEHIIIWILCAKSDKKRLMRLKKNDTEMHVFTPKESDSTVIFFIW